VIIFASVFVMSLATEIRPTSTADCAIPHAGNDWRRVTLGCH
jgi:hypothetical protein